MSTSVDMIVIQCLTEEEIVVWPDRMISFMLFIISLIEIIRYFTPCILVVTICKAALYIAAQIVVGMVVEEIWACSIRIVTSMERKRLVRTNGIVLIRIGVNRRVVVAITLKQIESVQVISNFSVSECVERFLY